MRAGVARPRVAAAVAEGVELLDIADVERGLRRHPGAQADLEGAVRQRIERAERQAGAGARFAGVGGDQDARLVRLHRDDRGGEPDFDRGERRVSAMRSGSLLEIEPERFALGAPAGRGRAPSTASTMRPLRSRMRSAWLTSMMFGMAVAEERRMRARDRGLVAARD